MQINFFFNNFKKINYINFIENIVRIASKQQIVEFFKRNLSQHITPQQLNYDHNLDGPNINPSLKIMGEGKNVIAQNRWEIFVLLLDENNEINLRSGVKSQTRDYDIQVMEQYDARLFKNSKDPKLISFLRDYRWGHPSLAINTSKLVNNQVELLPVFSGGWLLRNDNNGRQRIQIYWSSGRYSQLLNDKSLHLLELCVAFNLMKEYGEEFTIEFFNYNDTTLANILNKRAINGRSYTCFLVYNAVSKLIKQEQENEIYSALKKTPIETIKNFN